MNPFLEPYIPEGVEHFRLNETVRNDLAFSHYLINCIETVKEDDYGAAIIPTVRTVEQRLLQQLPTGRHVRTIGGFVHKCHRDAAYLERNFAGWPEIRRDNFVSILMDLSSYRGKAGHLSINHWEASWSLVLASLVFDQLEKHHT